MKCTLDYMPFVKISFMAKGGFQHGLDKGNVEMCYFPSKESKSV